MIPTVKLMLKFRASILELTKINNGIFDVLGKMMQINDNHGKRIKALEENNRARPIFLHMADWDSIGDAQVAEAKANGYFYVFLCQPETARIDV